MTPARPSRGSRRACEESIDRRLVRNTQLLVHPADVYVGLKSARRFVQQVNRSTLGPS